MAASAKIATAHERKTGRVLHAHHFFLLNDDSAASTEIESIVLRDAAAISGLDPSEISVTIVEHEVAAGPSRTMSKEITSAAGFSKP